MRAKADILIIAGLLFLLLLVGTVAAANPFTITINSSKSYVIAGYTDNQAAITVNVKNSTTNANIAGATVTFGVDDSSLGTYQKVGSILTDSNGIVDNTFIASTKSGNATLIVNVISSNETQVQTKFQKIDHDKPSKVKFVPPYEGTVGTTVAFNTSFTDFWGNPIDNVINPNEIHTVSLHVHGPSPDDCNFVGYGHDLVDTPLDATGNVPVMIKLTSVTGNNYVSMEAFDIFPQPKVINAIPGIPFTIEQTWNPSGNPPELPSGSSFTFVYTLYDKFRNPAGRQDVWINTTSGNNQLVKSEDNGLIQGTYEEIITGSYNITATAVNNNTVTISQTVRFYTANATSHNVLANPQTMPSRDVKSDISSTISAKVVDQGGNGVPNENVTFTLSEITYFPITVGNTSEPSFSNTGVVKTITALTGADGTAKVQFYPGAFVTTGPQYSQSATGNGKITATWNGIPKIVDVSWKNYAYLSAVLNVTPPQVKVGETVDVNLKLNGDGWNLARKPIDVVLIIDRSGSMLWNDGQTYNPSNPSPRRITSAKAAASTFVDAISDNTNNRAGLVSFASSTTKDQSLTNDFNDVKIEINNLNANGATQIRRALYEAITDLDDSGRAEAVKAVVLLTDGDWNYDGTPLAIGNGFPNPTSDLVWPGNVPNFDSYAYYSDLGGGSSHTQSVWVPDGSHWDGSNYVADYESHNRLHYHAQTTSQNMSVYAKENDVRLYALSFVDEPSPAVQSALTVLTTSTGDEEKQGFYQHAPDADTLNSLYENIALQLQEDAGVDTTADMDFGHLIVDDELIDTTAPGNAMFDYVGDPATPGINPGDSFTISPGSTMVDKYNATHHIIPGPDFSQDGPLIVNQSTDWNNNKSLNFNIGVVKLGQTWETNFRLRVLKEGTILLFSPGSTVNFKDSEGVESSLALKNLSFFTAVEESAGLTIQKIDVSLVCPTQPPTNSTAILPITWNTTYVGDETDIFEEIRYISESGAQVPFYQKGYHVTGDKDTINTAEFDMRKVAPGDYYFMVRAYTPKTTSTSSPICGPYLYNTTGKQFITLK
jgi:hypothetical protein